MIAFELQGMRLRSPLNGSQGAFWLRAKERKTERHAAAWHTMRAIRQAALVWAEKWTITITRIGPRALDDDNLAASAKSVRDGIADALGVKDNDPRITWLYAQERGPYAVRVEIRPRPRSESILDYRPIQGPAIAMQKGNG